MFVVQHTLDQPCCSRCHRPLEGLRHTLSAYRNKCYLFDTLSTTGVCRKKEKKTWPCLGVVKEKLRLYLSVSGAL